MRALALMPLLALAACATPDDLRKEAPALMIETTLKPDQVRDCMVETAPTQYQQTPYKGGWIINQTAPSVLAQGVTAFVVQITPTDKGSHVEVWHNLRGTYSETVQPCLDKLPRA